MSAVLNKVVNLLFRSFQLKIVLSKSVRQLAKFILKRMCVLHIQCIL